MESVVLGIECGFDVPLTPSLQAQPFLTNFQKYIQKRVISRGNSGGLKNFVYYIYKKEVIMKKENKKTKEQSYIEQKECQLTLGVMAVLYTTYFS